MTPTGHGGRLAAEVYEQAPVLEEAGAGVGLWPNAMAALEPIGLSGKVAAGRRAPCAAFQYRASTVRYA